MSTNANPTPAPRSWKPEVIADSSGKWCGNALRFATEDEAHRWARDLSFRWIAVRDYRAAPSDDPVNYVITPDGHARSLESDAASPAPLAS